MNEILKSLYNRKSVRVFEAAAIEPEKREAVLNAAMQAPTAGNQQMYTIIEIESPALKQQLSVSCDNQPFIAKAPLVLVFCADLQKWYDAFIEGGASPRAPGAGDLMLAMQDSTIAAQNAVVAAESLGLGSCYIGDIMENCEQHRQMLNLPPYVFPAVMLVLGYPTRQQKQRTKPARCELRYMVHTNGYRRMEGAELREMFAKNLAHQSFEEWSRAFCERKYNSAFSREMTRSVQKYLEAFGVGE